MVRIRRQLNGEWGLVNGTTLLIPDTLTLHVPLLARVANSVFVTGAPIERLRVFAAAGAWDRATSPWTLRI